MIVKKDKQFLVFYLDDSSVVKYDLATKQTIGKSGRVVKDLRTQLRGYSINQVIEAVEDDTYKKLLRFVKDRSYGITSFGSLIEKAKCYSRYEQIFSAGIDIERGETIHGDIPKGLIKICRTHDIKLTDNFMLVYQRNPDMLTHLFSQDCLFLTKQDLKNLLVQDMWRGEDGSFMQLVHEYHYNPKALLKYVDYLCGYEALPVIGWHHVLGELKDYARMARAMSHKFEKYPKNFLTVHKITSRNYNRLKAHYDEIAFQNRYDKSLEKRIDDYVFIYPKHTDEIRDEAVQQGNCVASYIEGVIEGKCHILFMRKREDPEKSVVTIEVRGDKVVQAKGKFNRETTYNEVEIIQKYNQYLASRKVGDAA